MTAKRPLVPRHAAISRRHAIGVSLGALVFASTGRAFAATGFEVSHSDAEWQKLLSLDQYAVLREKATEPPESSPLNDEQRAGLYACAGCDLALFSSTTKYDSGEGWPSFWAPLPDAVVTREDDSYGNNRTEVLCRRCGGHIGHVFPDGPRPTGLRYCMNGTAMLFRPGAAI
jgi:peptide-methionine (R)-S-oxide reductase